MSPAICISRLTSFLTLLALPCTSIIAAQPDAATHAQALEILQKSIAFRTVQDSGQPTQVPVYAEYLKGVLVQGGYLPEDIQIEKVAGTATLRAIYRGKDRSKKPIVVNGHMDVVEAKREDWERDPFTPVVENGYVYGRGAVDNKFATSMIMATLVHLKRSGWKPGRDVVLALSGDEETSMASTRALAKELSNAEMVLNGDGGGGLISEEGKPVIYGIQAGEKTYADFEVTFTNPGGHSSRPGPTNAIYQLSAALGRIGAYQFPVMQSELTKAYFAASAPNTPGEVGEAMKRLVANPHDEEAIATLSANPEYVGQLRTTCVATMLSGGHAQNALPQKATANVNCRIFPGTPVESVRQTLEKVMNDPAGTIKQVDGPSVEGGASTLRKDVMAAISKSIHSLYPGLPIVPSMSAGATDSMHFRVLGIPSYGVSGLFMKASDDFSHGLNERAPVAAIDPALAHWDSILRDLAK
jgi:acetylornithine deacetylase/succinyl-diaminopimelate desuccinylase-like protein